MQGGKMTATIRIVITDEFNNSTDITKTIADPTIETLYQTIREALLGSGWQPDTVNEWFPNGQ
jgi:hypothetical protein